MFRQVVQQMARRLQSEFKVPSFPKSRRPAWWYHFHFRMANKNEGKPKAVRLRRTDWAKAALNMNFRWKAYNSDFWELLLIRSSRRALCMCCKRARNQNSEFCINGLKVHNCTSIQWWASVSRSSVARSKPNRPTQRRRFSWASSLHPRNSWYQKMKKCSRNCNRVSMAKIAININCPMTMGDICQLSRGPIC